MFTAQVDADGPIAPNERAGFRLSIECMNTVNEGLLVYHRVHGCPAPHQPSHYRKLLE